MDEPLQRYRTKPRTVWAVQWFPGVELPPGIIFGDLAHPYVVTMHEQPVYLEAGDMLIQEPDGVHYYPCKPLVFIAAYERVTDE